MNKKLLVILSAAAVLSLAPFSVLNASVTASASSNNTAEAADDTTVTVVEAVVEEETEEVVDYGTVYAEYLETLESDIAEISALAAADGTTGTYEITVNNDDGFSMPNSMMQELVAAGNVDFTVHFTYDGVEYTVTIPAGQAIDDTIPWYGPLYLLQYYGSADTGTTAASASTYTVKSGDTLSSIAAANGLTVDGIAALNPDIANVNLIYPGQIIQLQ